MLATGPSAAVAGKAAVSALKGVTVPDNALQDAAQKYGVALGTDPAYQALALGMKLDAVVRVTTIDKGTAQLAVVQVRDGSTGAIVDDATWKAANAKALGQMLSKQMKPRFQRSLAGTKAPRPGSLQPVPAAGGVAGGGRRSGSRLLPRQPGARAAALRRRGRRRLRCRPARRRRSR